MRHLLLLLFAVSPPLAADDICPYLNAATAGGVVGGAVTTTFISSSKTTDDGACRFIRRNAALTSELSIEVATMSDPVSQFSAYLAKCGPKNTNLTAIGNEAVSCGQTDKVGRRNEEVIGRVRDRAFTIQLSTDDPSATSDLLRAKLIGAAEQVAGILF